MPVTVYVSPSEWRYVSALYTIAEFEREKMTAKGVKPQEASRHMVTKVLRPLEDYAAGRMGKAATISRMMDILERDFGFSSEEEADRVAEAVARIVDEVGRVKGRQPEHIFDFIESLRYALLGFFRGYLVPGLKEPNSHGGETA